MELMKQYKSFVTKEESFQLLNILQAMCPWGPFLPSPKSRKVCGWNIMFQGNFDPSINDIFKNLCYKLKRQFNANVVSIFCNLYENGSDHCPYHKDRYGCNIFTLSLGETRDFLTKPDEKGTKSTKYKLESGDLYFMHNDIHANHKHSIPKRKNIKNPRISIVFFLKN